MPFPRQYTSSIECPLPPYNSFHLTRKSSPNPLITRNYEFSGVYATPGSDLTLPTNLNPVPNCVYFSGTPSPRAPTIVLIQLPLESTPPDMSISLKTNFHSPLYLHLQPPSTAQPSQHMDLSPGPHPHTHLSFPVQSICCCSYFSNLSHFPLHTLTAPSTHTTPPGCFATSHQLPTGHFCSLKFLLTPILLLHYQPHS